MNDRCGEDIIGSGLLCARRKGHVYPKGERLCTSNEELAKWLDGLERPRRVRLSNETRAELLARVENERPGVRLGDQMHGPWCELVHEENRWWQAYLAARSAGADIDHAMDDADAAIAEAKKRERL